MRAFVRPAGRVAGAPSENPASSPRKVGQPSADCARIASMTSGALLSTRPRVWDTSGATPHAARAALECALESVPQRTAFAFFRFCVTSRGALTASLPKLTTVTRRAPTSAVCSAASPARRRVSRTPPRTRTRASSGARTRFTTTCSTRRSTSRARRWSSPGLKSRRTAPTSSPTSRKAPSESLSSLRTEHEVALAYLLAWLIACKGTRARGRAFGRGPFISSQC